MFSLTEGARTLEAGFSGAIGLLRATLQIAPLFALLVWLESTLALLAFAALALFGALLRGVRRQLNRAQKRALEGSEELTLAADEAVRHADVWKTFGAEERVKERLARIGSALGRRASRVAALAAAASGLNEVLAGVVLLALLGAARAGWLGEVRFERLLPFVVTFFLAYRPLRDAAEAQLALSRARAAWAMLRPITRAPEGDRGERRFDLAPLEVDLVLARGSRERVAFRAKPGAIVVLRGPTGAGKTTLLRALLGLEPALGVIRYGGEPVEAPPGRGRPFAWVPQDAPILDGTLADNVAIAGGDVRGAIDAVGASALARDLGDARIGPRDLSGGERQLVCLARALATDRPVLLLDEPTSGLDPSAERTVLAAIERVRGERTVILVTHRAEPLRIADATIELASETKVAPRARAARP